jgi:hypothetical protein
MMVAPLSRLDITARMRGDKCAALYHIAETAVSAEDMPALYSGLHGIVGELMYAHNLYIALYDEARDGLSFLFRGREWTPPRRSRLGKSLTGMSPNGPAPALHAACVPGSWSGAR